MGKSKPVKTKNNPQTELSFPSPLRADFHFLEGNACCPIYFPKSGDELKKLALALNPIVAKAGWGIRLLFENEESFLELFDKNKKRPSRRLFPDEIVAWQAILPELMGDTSVLKVGFKED